MTFEHAVIYVDGGDSAMRRFAWDLLHAKMILKANYLDSSEIFLKDGSREKISASGRTLQLLCSSDATETILARLPVGMSAFAVPCLAAKLD